MPVKLGIDKKGPYYRWGLKTKYYFNPTIKSSEIKAHKKAVRQGRAIKANIGNK